ncbi:MAG: endo-1,4-beta-xylanase [Verrucomicrobiota bacterium]|nr:endo-1,4-beta-xylanase [Verrucomicrobiota bacterium]
MKLLYPWITLLAVSPLLSTLEAAIRTEIFSTAPETWQQVGEALGFSPTAYAKGEVGEAGGSLLGDSSRYEDILAVPLTFGNVVSGAGSMLIQGTEGECFIGHVSRNDEGIEDTKIGITVSIKDGHYDVIDAVVKLPNSAEITVVRETAPAAALTKLSWEALYFSYLYVPACADGQARLYVWSDAMEAPVVLRVTIKNPEAFQLKAFGFGGESKQPVSQAAAPSVYVDNLTYTVGDNSTKPTWWDAAMQRIDEYRKGDLLLTVKNAEGAPVSGAEVAVRQVSTKYGFGTAISEAYLYDNKDTRDGRLYALLAKQLFNKAVLENGHKWSRWEDAARRVKTDYTVEWILGAGLELRGHTMIWQRWDFIPVDLKEKETDKEYLATRAVEHVTAIGTFYKDTIKEWDVVNEQYQENVLTDIIDGENKRDSAPSLLTWYNAAAAAIPGGQFYLNDFGILHNNQLGGKAKVYENQIKYLTTNGAPLSGIGFQGHYWDSSTRPKNADLWKLFEKFAAFNMDLQITEFDMWGGGWTSQTQAEWSRELYAMAYSHPRFEGFVIWGFWDGKHWQNSAPLFDKNWALKPSGEALLDLTCREFRTNAHGLTNASGKYRTRAFKGDYVVTITHPDGTKEEMTATVDRSIPVNENPFEALQPVNTDGVKEGFVGYLFDASYPWVYAFNQGWWYLYAIDEQHFWAWDLTPGMEWLFVDATVWPWVYSFGHGSWLSYGGGEAGIRYFYKVTEDKWLVLPLSGN